VARFQPRSQRFSLAVADHLFPNLKLGTDYQSGFYILRRDRFCPNPLHIDYPVGVGVCISEGLARNFYLQTDKSRWVLVWMCHCPSIVCLIEEESGGETDLPRFALYWVVTRARCDATFPATATDDAKTVFPRPAFQFVHLSYPARMALVLRIPNI